MKKWYPKTIKNKKFDLSRFFGFLKNQNLKKPYFLSLENWNNVVILLTVYRQLNLESLCYLFAVVSELFLLLGPRNRDYWAGFSVVGQGPWALEWWGPWVQRLWVVGPWVQSLWVVGPWIQSLWWATFNHWRWTNESKIIWYLIRVTISQQKHEAKTQSIIF